MKFRIIIESMKGLLTVDFSLLLAFNGALATIQRVICPLETH